MRAQDYRRAVFKQEINRRQRRLDAGIIGHCAALQRYVEIHPHQGAFTLNVNIFDGFFIEHNPLLSF